MLKVGLEPQRIDFVGYRLVISMSSLCHFISNTRLVPSLFQPSFVHSPQ